MQPTQDFMSVPRRPLDVEDYVDILRRHKSWMAGPAFAALVLSVVVAFTWPDTYLSEATVQVIAPQVPERYVPSNVNSEMSQRINQMAQTVQSRANLINIIQNNNLYRTELQHKPLEDVIEQMRSSVKISDVENLRRAARSSTRPSGSRSNTRTGWLAQKVTQELVRGFIDENIRSLSSQSTATTEFLKDEWEAAKKNLDDLENRLTQFRLQNSGRLPEQLQSNLATLRTLEQQLSGVNEGINRIGQEKLLLESQLRVYRDQLQSLTQKADQPLSAAAKNERLNQLEREIVNQETTVSAMKERYKPTHPDVRAAEAQLAMLRGRRDALLKDEQEKKPTPTPRKTNPTRVQGARELEAQISGLQSQIQARDLALEERTKAQKQLVTLINQYNERIQSSPLMEKNYTELTRDYDASEEQVRRAERQEVAVRDRHQPGEPRAGRAAATARSGIAARDAGEAEAVGRGRFGDGDRVADRNLYWRRAGDERYVDQEPQGCACVHEPRGVGNRAAAGERSGGAAQAETGLGGVARGLHMRDRDDGRFDVLLLCGGEGVAALARGPGRVAGSGPPAEGRARASPPEGPQYRDDKGDEMSRVHDALRRAGQTGATPAGNQNVAPSPPGAASRPAAPLAAGLLSLDDVQEVQFSPSPEALLIDASRPQDSPSEEFRSLRTRLESSAEPAAHTHGGGYQPFPGRGEVVLGGQSGAGRSADWRATSFCWPTSISAGPHSTICSRSTGPRVPPTTCWARHLWRRA